MMNWCLWNFFLLIIHIDHKMAGKQKYLKSTKLDSNLPKWSTE